MRALGGRVFYLAPADIAGWHKTAHYDALGQANKDNELTYWLEYFARTLLKAQLQTQARIEFLIAKARLYDRLRGQLNARQEKVLARMFREGPHGLTGGLSAENYIRVGQTSAATATRHPGPAGPDAAKVPSLESVSVVIPATIRISPGIPNRTTQQPAAPITRRTGPALSALVLYRGPVIADFVSRRGHCLHNAVSKLQRKQQSQPTDFETLAFAEFGAWKAANSERGARRMGALARKSACFR